MNNLRVFEQGGQLLTTSREVAAMVEKEHSKLLRDVRTYCEYLTEANFGLSDFFLESAYTDSTGRTLPCYLLTKKGCDMVANKLTGQKGVLFTAAYVTAFEKMQKQLSNEKPLQSSPIAKEMAEAKLLNARARVASQWLKMGERVKLEEYQQICAHYASNVLAGHEVLPLPESGERYYTATELGERFGLSAQKIGIIANREGLKTDVYGKWYHDKSRYSNKEVDTFKYNHKAIERLEEILI